MESEEQHWSEEIINFAEKIGKEFEVKPQFIIHCLGGVIGEEITDMIVYNVYGADNREGLASKLKEHGFY